MFAIDRRRIILTSTSIKRLSWSRKAEAAIRLSDAYGSHSQAELRAISEQLSYHMRGGAKVASRSVEIAALVREAARRHLNMAHYPVQLVGGFAMLEGHIAEMRTGEGKTLTALIPGVAYALAGDGCHILTSNDYLASRDAELLSPVYQSLGLSVGCVTAEMSPEARRQAYDCDVTYSTAKEVGFDFLRDCINSGVETGRVNADDCTGWSSNNKLQRGHFFALVDEADAILIDEATMPLIIAVSQPTSHETLELYRWCNQLAAELKMDEDFEYVPKKRTARLSEDGCRTVLLANRPRLLAGVEIERIYQQTENALVARHAFLRDRDYLVVDKKVVLVDESTGRVMEGRKMQDGMHQAIEAKEDLPITSATGSAAQITSQSYFRLYTHLAGMTGTLEGSQRELRRSFGLRATRIPTHRRPQRIQMPTVIVATLEEKDAAVVNEVQAMLGQSRPVLIGTPSVEASERLSKILDQHGIEHQVLNARNHADEAEIIKDAGQPAAVTIATNMAGRGTDIKLAEKVRSAGGLHVIATEMHSSPRIDRQLIGRCGRQGDPGSVRFMLSLEDGFSA